MTLLLTFIQKAIGQGVAILFGASGEIVTEKSGNLNLGIPGIMYMGGIAGLMGAFFYEKSTETPNGAIGVLVSLFWLGVSAFKSDADVIKWPPIFFPTEWVTTQFAYVWKVLPIARMLLNTVVFAGGVTIISLFFDSMAAYAFARMKFTGRKLLFGIILLTMMIPFQVVMIPLYMEEYKLGILNTFLGLILPRAASAYGIFMLTSFFSGIPKSLDEAAKIDGMGEWKIYLKIILPLAKPALVTLGIYHFMNNWNDLLYPMMLTSSVEMRTLSAGLAILVGSNSIKYGPTLAATVIAILPLLLLFLFGQKFFMEGIATSGMKE